MHPSSGFYTREQGVGTLDEVVTGALHGSLVWQVDTVRDYEPFAARFAAAAAARGEAVVYFHFDSVEEMRLGGVEATTVPVFPQEGFEVFINGLLDTISARGASAAYLFDCISPLAADWFSDQMAGNFFVIVGAALRAAEASACFSILRNLHSQYAMDPIVATANGLLDVCRYRDRLFVQPLKLEYKRAACRHTLHAWSGESLRPVTDSHTAASVLTNSRRDNLGLARHHLGVWSSTFIEAETLLTAEAGGDIRQEERDRIRDKILRMAVTRDARVQQLVRRYFTLEYLLFLGTRMLGTGLIGGKAADMLLARAVLLERDARWNEVLEAHDSFFIPSDVFYTFLVQNECWELRRRLMLSRGRFDIASEVRRRILNGAFPAHIMRRFSDMLDYFGETPIVVRSSSLLEDSFGNAFSGKYESVFCCNRGDRGARLEQLVDAIKRVYASALSKDALDYRARHGLLERDEQMAILVQRVAGAFHGNLYFPHLAAVGFSFNPYGWHEDIDPRAGVLRLVFGLGTRAVERSDDDYTRLVALNAPHLRPDSFSDDLPVPAQQWVDVLDLEQGRVSSRAFRELTPDLDAYVLSQVATEDPLVARAAKRQGIRNPFLLRLSFEGLLKHGDFVASARTMLRLLEEAYEGPVDVELAVNFREDGSYRIHLLQCRPMQVKGMDHPELPPLLAPEDTVIFRCHGPVIGRSRFIEIAFLLYVVPEKYSALSEREQYAVARILGELNRRLSGPEVSGGLMLVGPGRWGSAMPSLGLPVSFADINHAAVICEILAIREDLVTEVSLGTHFFNDLVELDMLYISLKQDDRDAVFYRSRLEQAPNLLAALMPEAARYEDCLRLIQGAENASGKLWLRADTQGQDVCLYREE